MAKNKTVPEKTVTPKNETSVSSAPATTSPPKVNSDTTPDELSLGQPTATPRNKEERIEMIKAGPPPKAEPTKEVVATTVPPSYFKRSSDIVAAAGQKPISAKPEVSEFKTPKGPFKMVKEWKQNCTAVSLTVSFEHDHRTVITTHARGFSYNKQETVHYVEAVVGSESVQSIAVGEDGLWDAIEACMDSIDHLTNNRRCTSEAAKSLLSTGFEVTEEPDTKTTELP